MKEKYFNVKELNVGCLGSVNYLGSGNGADWIKKDISPYTVFKVLPSENLDGCHEAKDVFCNDKYYFLNEVSRKDCNLEMVHGRYVIGKSVPLSVVCGSGVKKISSIQLKNIMNDFNVTDALIKNRYDGYLILLKKCVDDLDLMGDGKVKEYYTNSVSSLLVDYVNAISDSSTNSRDFDIIIDDINYIRHELDRERELVIKKTKKLNKDFTKR